MASQLHDQELRKPGRSNGNVCVVRFLASDDSADTTGAIIDVNGGIGL